MNFNKATTVLSNTGGNKKRLVSLYEADFVDVKHFGNSLVRALKARGLKKKDLAEMTGKSLAQITKYCDTANFPPLAEFRIICLKLNADPVELLGIERVDAVRQPEIGVIYDWQFVAISSMQKRLEWKCPLCQGDNISYEVSDLKALRKINIACEFCHNTFYRLDSVEFKLSILNTNGHNTNGHNGNGKK